MMVHKSHCLLLLSLLLLHASSADDETFEVVGTAECADCKENNFKTTQPFSGLGVTIDCKLKDGDMRRIGASELDEQGNFRVSLPQHMIEKEGRKLKEECYAQLHSAASIPCPAHNNALEASKIIFKSQNNGKHIFVPIQNLLFSSALCTSKSFWPIFKYPPLQLKHFGHPWLFPPLPPHPHDKPLPPIYKPPVVKLLPPPAPGYEVPAVKPLPPPTPVYKPKPKPPVVKPLPPPAPVYKPKPPVVKPPAPVYKPKPPAYKPPKKPCPPIKPKPPIYKPPVEKPPVHKPPVVKPLPPPIPIYKPPVIKKPLTPQIPLYPIPPITKKPCPPLPKLPPFPKIPPKYFHHPKFGYFPPLPPSIPHA